MSNIKAGDWITIKDNPGAIDHMGWRTYYNTKYKILAVFSKDYGFGN